MTGQRHVSLERIVAGLLGESTWTPAEEAHLTSCERCSALQRRLAAMRAAAADGGEPPPDWVRRAESIPDRDSALEDSDIAQLATVLHDGTIGRAAGMRAGAAGRQWLFAAGSIEIEVSAGTMAGETWSLSGQLVTLDPGKEVAGCTVAFESADGTIMTARASDLGDFVLQPPHPGPFRLRFSGSGWEIRTPPLEP